MKRRITKKSSGGDFAGLYPWNAGVLDEATRVATQAYQAVGISELNRVRGDNVNSIFVAQPVRPHRRKRVKSAPITQLEYAVQATPVAADILIKPYSASIRSGDWCSGGLLHPLPTTVPVESMPEAVEEVMHEVSADEAIADDTYVAAAVERQPVVNDFDDPDGWDHDDEDGEM